jgi:hypothetical protein
MKTKKYEFSKKYVPVWLSTTEHERSDISLRMQQRCFKKITRFFFASATITLFYSHSNAQIKSSEPTREKPSTSLMASLYGKERNHFSTSIKRHSTRVVPIEFHSNETKAVIANQDYFSADLFLNDDVKKAPTGHNTQIARYDNQNVTVDGLIHDNLTVYEIFDRYTLRDKNTDSDYHYDNIYYLFRNAQGSNIATVYYIDRTVGFLRSEYKVVSKEKPGITFPLVVAPNPAKNIINITYQAEKSGQASLQIIDINGRTADVVFSNKPIQSGKHTVQHNISLPAGNYLIRFNVEGYALVTQKLIVQ